MKKKLLSTLLAAAMVLSLLPAVAFAEESTTEPAAEPVDTAALTEALPVAAATDPVVVNTVEELNSAITAGNNIKLGADFTDIGDITISTSIIINGDGKKISGKSRLYATANCDITITNVVFENINDGNDATDSSTGYTAIYGKGLANKLTITNCTFDNSEWDAIQITPVANAEIVITGNTFRHTATMNSGTAPKRYVHIQSNENVDFKATVTNNNMYGGSSLRETGFEIYYFTNAENVNLSGNYLDEPTAACILMGSGTNVSDMIFPLKETPESVNADYTLPVRILRGGYNVYYFATLEEAAAFATPATDIISLIGDVTLGADLTLPKTVQVDGTDVTVDLGTHTLTAPTSGSVADPEDDLFRVKNGGSLTVKNGIMSAHDIGIYSQGDGTHSNTVVLDDVDMTSGYFGIYHNGSKSGANVTVKNGSSITDTFSTGIYISGNSTFNPLNTLVVDNSTISSRTAVEVKFTDVTLTNATLTATDATPVMSDSGSGTCTYGYALAVTNNDTSSSADFSDGKVTITGGYYTGAIGIKPADETEENTATIAIDSGNFTVAPNKEYLAEGKAAVANPDTESDYRWVIGVEGATPAEIVPAAPEADKAADLTINGDGASDLLDAVLGALKPEGDSAAPSIDTNVLSNAVADLAQANTIKPDDSIVTDAFEKAHMEIGDDDTVTIVIQPYMDIKIADVTVTETIKSVTLNITPMYQMVATTADLSGDDPEDIVIEPGDGETQNAVPIGDAQKLVIKDGMKAEVTIPLPESIVDAVKYTDADGKENQVNVGHEGYTYIGTVDNNNVLTFTVTHGFSPFKIGGVEIVAKIGGTTLDSLASAVEKVGNDSTIILQMDNDEAISVSKNITFTVDANSKKFNPAKITAGPGYSMTKTTTDDKTTYTFTKDAPSTGGGTYVPTYTVTVEKPEHGTVTVSPKNASKGQTVTITVTPDKGYELDWLFVTDKNGDELALTDKGNGKFTFKMPASKVSIEAWFTETAPVVVENPYVDVFESDYYYNEVLYAYENGLMVGNGDTFAPKASFDRKQLAMLLWNMEGKPVVNYAMSFNDVPAGQWYTEAIRWAASTGVMTGYGADTFGTDDLLTRQQMATAFFRYAEAKAEKGNLNDFTDGAQVADWAADGMVWAVNHGLFQGYNNCLTPGATANRAQVAIILYRYCENIA